MDYQTPQWATFRYNPAPLLTSITVWLPVDMISEQAFLGLIIPVLRPLASSEPTLAGVAGRGAGAREAAGAGVGAGVGAGARAGGDGAAAALARGGGMTSSNCSSYSCPHCSPFYSYPHCSPFYSYPYFTSFFNHTDK